MLQTANEGATDSEDPTLTIPAWLDIDPAVVQDVLGEVTLKKFQFRQAVGEVAYLQKVDFPFPEEKITREQLQTLISLRTRRCRNMYVHALSGAEGCLDPDDVVKMDAEWPDTMFSEEQVASVAEDEEMAARLQLAQYCEQKLVKMGEILPKEISDRSFRSLLRRSSESGMCKEIEYMIYRENVRIKDWVWRCAKKAQGVHKKAEALEERAKNTHINYGLTGNRIFFRISESTISHFEQWRIIKESNPWGNPPIVLDLSFLKDMYAKEAMSIATREIPYAISYLKRSGGPLAPIYLTSFDPNCDGCRAFTDFFCLGLNQTDYFSGAKNKNKTSVSDFYLHITEKSYIDLFPAQNLVYLSPDSRTDLTEYRDDDIMILGALIGKDSSNHTLTRAKQAGIRHARLPMRKVLGFTSSLNIDACVPILNDFRNTKDWFYSFRWIPPRYIRKVVENRGMSKDEFAIVEAMRKLSPVQPNVPSEVAGLNQTAYRQKYLESLREHFGDKASLPGPGPLFGLTAYAKEQEARWREREDRKERRFKSRSREANFGPRDSHRQTEFSGTIGTRRQGKFSDTMSDLKPERVPFTSDRVPGSPVR